MIAALFLLMYPLISHVLAPWFDGKTGYKGFTVVEDPVRLIRTVNDCTREHLREAHLNC